MQRLQKSWKHTVNAWTTTGTCGSIALPNAWCQPIHFLTVRFYSHNFGKCRKEQKAFEEKCPPSGWKADTSQAISNLPLHAWLPEWLKTLSANYFEGSGVQGCYAAMHPALSLQHTLLSHVSQGQISVLMLCVYNVNGLWLLQWLLLQCKHAFLEIAEN